MAEVNWRFVPPINHEGTKDHKGHPNEVSFSCALVVSRTRTRLNPAYNASMIEKELMDILVCPVCKQALIQKDDGTSLKCSECRRVYPVRDNIPIMLVDEATIDPA
jgi:uncharacterized protein YbaR (Trm112 family)